MDIKKLEREDIDKCVDLCIASSNRPPWNHQWGYDRALKYLKEFADQPRFVGFAIYEQGAITGILLAHTKTWWENDLLYIDEFFIVPEKQRIGYGKRLLNHAEAYAREQGCGIVSLVTTRYMLTNEFRNDLNYHHAEHYMFLFKPV
ncbi:GNAT family N-acetyltransferase [Mucilaginibacter flavus]|uniref:GNAT family N-acetyltransferase n=1 Tax=Mucilaginibacter flavus TaxID=931504 RepID=UPI0025B2A241|nr:GNAT family N-acetyltransferase [Mucilaginibacter flavus]MDN3584969.1 GNAT family N-acetyltransferase [Mucilaginibacter flavus]